MAPSSPSAASSSSDYTTTSSSSSSPISPDNLTTQLLARLDFQSYTAALTIDSHTLSHNFLLPHDFPWARFRRYYCNHHYPEEEMVPPSTETFVEKELPFDIDELVAICYYDKRK
eukprot:scaffold17115_cov125-Skeletonema_menzelii.AAC.1